MSEKEVDCLNVKDDLEDVVVMATDYRLFIRDRKETTDEFGDSVPANIFAFRKSSAIELANFILSYYEEEPQ